MTSTWKAAASASSLINWWGSNDLLAVAQKHAQDAADTAATLARKATVLAEQAAETAKVLVAQAQEEAPKLLQLSPQEEDAAHSKQLQAAAPSFEELQAYGVTDDLVTFAKGLTYSTFSDFPAESLQPLFPLDKPRAPESKEFQLSPWQERHARLVLQAVPQLQDLRFVLCPRRMSEEQFWTIYFNTLRQHLPHQAFGWHAAVDTRPPLAPRSQHQQKEMSRAGSIAGLASSTGGATSPMHSAKDMSVGDSSSMVMVDKWSETEGEAGAELDNDPDLDAYLREALTMDEAAEEAAADDVSNTEDLDDYLDQLDAEIQDAANKSSAP